MTGPWLFDGPPDARQARYGAGDTGDAFPAAVLFDRDGTLVADVPYNGDPARVAPMPSARDAVDAVRALGIPVGIVSNQSGVARGLLTRRQVEAVRRRVEDLLGPFAVWAVCPHGPDDGCGCRKPAPGLVLTACERLGVAAERTAVIGDIGADVAAARAARARGVLVPTAATLPEETEAAEAVATDLLEAVRLVLGSPLDERSGHPSAAAAGGAPRPVPPGGANGAPGEARGPEGRGRPDPLARRPEPVAPGDSAHPIRRTAGGCGPAQGRVADGMLRPAAAPDQAAADRRGGLAHSEDPDGPEYGAGCVVPVVGEA